MRTRTHLHGPILAALAFAAAVAGCASFAPVPVPGVLPAFGSDAELSDFLDAATAQWAGPTFPPLVEPCDLGGGTLSSVTPGVVAGGGAVVSGSAEDPAGEPLAGGAVMLAGTVRGVLTSAAGEYRLEVPAGMLQAGDTLEVRLGMIGYGSESIRVVLEPGDSAVITFVLCPAILRLETAAIAAPAPSVTNVQHADVDEGGLVKVHGDHLVILRRGRLFTVAIGDDRLAPAHAIPAYAPGIDPRRTWYDELLVSDDHVVVIGYSYERGGTEVGVFRVDGQGQLTHRATYHLRSNDYYSSRNYASRLVGSRLVFYTPLRVAPRDDGSVPLPAMRRWRDDADPDDFEPIVTPSRVYRPAGPLDPATASTLHTVTSCDLAAPTMECEATSVVGPSGRSFYVSPTAVYVWVSGRPRSGDDDEVRPPGPPGMLYRIPVDLGAPTALGVHGSPTDQFSFLEGDDGHLNVLVRDHAFGDAMWAPEHAAGKVALLRVALGDFSDGTRAAAPADYRPLPGPEHGAFVNRFVGGHLLYGAGTGWASPDDARPATLYVVRWADGALAELSMPHSVERIEAMGDDAVVIGSHARDLHFTGVALGALPSPVQHYVRIDAAQGELRSHGFFYRYDDYRSGIIALPIRGGGRPGYEHLVEGSAAVLFLQNADDRFAELGALVARPADSADDGCVASCVDWYGNARPLFLRNRIFALLGYELVEGTMRDGRVHEVRRVDFAPRPVATTDRGPGGE